MNVTEKLRKLQALADRGATEGERRAAREAIKRIIQSRPAEQMPSRREEGRVSFTSTDMFGRNPYTVTINWPGWMPREFHGEWIREDPTDEAGHAWVMDGFVNRCTRCGLKLTAAGVMAGYGTTGEWCGTPCAESMPGYAGRWEGEPGPRPRGEGRASVELPKADALGMLQGDLIVVTLKDPDCGKPIAWSCTVVGITISGRVRHPTHATATLKLRVEGLARPSIAVI